LVKATTFMVTVIQSTGTLREVQPVRSRRKSTKRLPKAATSMTIESASRSIRCSEEIRLLTWPSQQYFTNRLTICFSEDIMRSWTMQLSSSIGRQCRFLRRPCLVSPVGATLLAL
jgi:hypothetical protein